MILLILRKRTLKTKYAQRVNSPVSSISDSWSDKMAMIELNLEEDLVEVEKTKQQKKIKSLSTTKGITDSGLESEEEVCSTPSAMKGPPPKKEEAKLKGGDDQSMFTSLTKEPENTAEEVSDPTYNIKDSAD